MVQRLKNVNCCLDPKDFHVIIRVAVSYLRSERWHWCVSF